MMTLIFSLLLSFSNAADLNQLNSVSFQEVNKMPVLVFEFEQPVAFNSIEARFIRRTVEWDLSGVKLKKDKLFINVSKNDINNVYASHNDDKTVRVRVNMDHGKIASNYHERIQYSIEGNKLQLKMDTNVPLISNNIKEINRIYNIAGIAQASAIDKKAEEHIAAVSTMKLAEPEEDQKLADVNAPEDQIPLTAKKSEARSSGTPSLKRVAAGFFVLAVLLVSALLVTRRLKAKQAGAAFNHDSITVVSQKYLGPKRNLVLVRVTGEYLLLGVTDHNISLIKNLNVVDDEIPELTGKNFNEVLDKKEKSIVKNDEESVEDGFSVSSLDDVKKIFKKKRYIDEMDF